MRRKRIKFSSDMTSKKAIINIEDSIIEIREKIRKRGINDRQKDNISDSLDKVGDKVDDLHDKEKISNAEATLLKKKISEVKNKLDIPKEILQGLIKKRIICHFVDQMTDEILEVIHDETAFKEKIKESLYKNKKVRGRISNLIKDKIIKNKKYGKRK